MCPPGYGQGGGRGDWATLDRFWGALGYPGVELGIPGAGMRLWGHPGVVTGGYGGPLGESAFPSYRPPSKVLGGQGKGNPSPGEQGPSWGHPEANPPQCHLLPDITSPPPLFEDIFQYLIKFTISQGDRRQPQTPRKITAK